MASQQFRQEKDSIGVKEIPADVYYGVQTARAVENYPISGMRAHPTLIAAFGMVKRAAAEANKALALVDDKRVPVISATGSTQMGRTVAERCAQRLGGQRAQLYGFGERVLV